MDIVNEILEFFIVNGSLATFTGHDMAEDSVSADLLADPQFVEDTAYVKTNDEVFPDASVRHAAGGNAPDPRDLRHHAGRSAATARQRRGRAASGSASTTASEAS